MRRPPRGSSLAAAAVAAATLLSLSAAPSSLHRGEAVPDPRVGALKSYLESKSSPLSGYVPELLAQPEWRMLVAVSAIESQFCRRKIGFNCWGIGGGYGYRIYGSYPEAIEDAGELLSRRRAQGRWTDVESMDCSYVYPCNRNWVAVVSSTLAEVESLIPKK